MKGGWALGAAGTARHGHARARALTFDGDECDTRRAASTCLFTSSIVFSFAFSSASVLNTRWHADAVASAICPAIFLDLQPNA